jgi:hypothetical protein
MAVTAQGSGTQTATVGTEHTLLDVAVAGTFTLHVDAVNMVALDALELRIYQKILTGGTLRVAYFQTFYGAQAVDDLIKISVPISNDLVEAASLRFTLKQTYGTSRLFAYKVLKYA